MSVVKTSGPSSFLEAVAFASDMLRRGLVGGMSTHFESTTGIGRVAVTTIDGVDVELPGIPGDAGDDTIPDNPSSKREAKANDTQTKE